MSNRPPHPTIFALLYLPVGITTGYIIVVVPYLATHSGLSVATAASMVAVGYAPKAWKVLWSPLADMCLTLKTWYCIGVTLAGAMLIVSTLIPFSPSSVPLIAAALFAAELGCSLLVPVLGAFMADAVPDGLKGGAAGFYQLGGKLGRAIGGGAGLWLAVHGASPTTASLVLGLACLGCVGGLQFIAEPPRQLAASAVERFLSVGRELWQLMRSRPGLMVVLLSIAPIGISGADFFFSGIAGEWKVPVGTVALVTGFAGGLVPMAGCLLAGWWADRADRRMVYLATGVLVALSAAGLALAPHSPGVFVGGTLTLKFFIGMSDAAYVAMLLAVIGKSAAATKFTALGALSNVPEVYMTVVSGWVHDTWSTATMLIAESVAALLCIAFAFVFLKRYHEPEEALATSRAMRAK